jgi:hypothetical protein
MSLLNDASLVLIPSGYKANKVYSIIPSDGSGDLDFVRASNGTRINSLGNIENKSSNVPRLTYENGCPSLLLEKQSTNVVTYSEDFSNAAWVTDGLTVSSNSAVSPDGTQNADKLVSNNASGNKFIYQIDTVSIGASYTASAYFKSSEYTYAYFRLGGVTGNPYVIYNLTNQSLVSTSGSVTHSIQSIGNGWYRIILTVTTTSTVVAPVFSFLPTTGYTIDANNLPQYTGNGVNGGFIWGAQIEASAYPTSYIPTTSTSVTRLADSCSKTGISSLIGQGEGSILLDFNFKANNESILFDITNNSLAVQNRIILYTPGDYYIYLVVFDNGTNTVQIQSAQYSLTQRMKVGVRYKNNNTALYINGAQIGIDSSCSMPTVTLSRIDVGNRLDYTFPSMISVNQSLLFTRGLTNTELAQLTTI